MTNAEAKAISVDEAKEVKMGLSQMQEFADWRAKVVTSVGFFTLLLVVVIAVRWLS